MKEYEIEVTVTAKVFAQDDRELEETVMNAFEIPPPQLRGTRVTSVVISDQQSRETA